MSPSISSPSPPPAAANNFFLSRSRRARSSSSRLLSLFVPTAKLAPIPLEPPPRLAWVCAISNSPCTFANSPCTLSRSFNAFRYLVETFVNALLYVLFIFKAKINCFLMLGSRGACNVARAPFKAMS